MKRPCICIAAGFALGEVLAYAFMERDLVPAVFPCVAALLFCTLCALDHETSRADKLRALVILGLGLILGSGRLYMDVRTLDQKSSLDALCTGSTESFETEITGITVKGERLTLRCGELLVYYTPARDSSYTDTKGSIADIFSIGNRIRIDGDFDVMDSPRNPGEFNYRLYYLADGVTHRCFADTIFVTDDNVNSLPDAVFRLRRRLLDRIDLIYNDTDSGVIKAVLLGDKSSLNEDINDLYRRNGIAHLLAISGLHVGIIGMSIYRLLRRKLKLPYAVCGLVGGAWILFYCLLTGSGVSTLRATLMLLIMFLAGVLGMHYDMLSSAGLAALIILLIHPFQLFNCAFLLSFACIIAIAGPASYVTEELKAKNSILKSLILSLSVQTFTLPITAYYFFEVSPYGCLLNLIVIPLMTLVVWSSIIATLLSFVLPAAAIPLTLISHYILTFYTWLGNFTIRLPFSSILIGRPSLWQIFVYYLLFFSVLYFYRLKALIPLSPSSMWGRETGST